MQFTVGQKAWTINNYRTRSTLCTVRDVTATDIEVYNHVKDETQFFSIAAPHIALGDYWETQEVRPELVAFDNAEALRLNDERIHREHAERVRKAVQAASESPSGDSFDALRVEVARWAGHSLRKVAA